MGTGGPTSPDLLKARKRLIRRIDQRARLLAYQAKRANAAERRAIREENRMRVEAMAAPIRSAAKARLATLPPSAPRPGGADPETEALAFIREWYAIDLREAQRRRAMILRDDIERRRNLRRHEARQDVASGNYASLEDAKDTATPEQLASGDFVPFEVDNPMDTVREPISTVKRMPRLVRLWRAGILDDDLYKACLWYRNQWERSGLDPLIASTFDPKYGAGERLFGHMGKTPSQVEARSELRWAQTYIPVELLKFFEMVVIKDHTIRSATKEMHIRHANGNAAFKRAALCLLGGIGSALRLDQKIVP